MKFLELRGEDDLVQLQSAWDALLRQSATVSIFNTWEWANVWWSAYGKTGDLRVLLFVDDDGTPRGIAPLRRQTLVRYGQSAAALALIGDGSNDSDYLDFIIAAGYEERVMAAFRRYWLEQAGSEALLQFNEVPGDSASLLHLQTLAKERGMVWQEADVDCGTVRLPETWDGYLSALRPRFRTKVRSVLRGLEGRMEPRFGFCQTRQELERLLPALYDLHKRRWATEGKPGVFGWDRKRDFYSRLSPVLLDRGWLRFSWLEWNGHILACQYGFIYGKTYFHLQEGYEPAAEHANLGIGLRAWSMRELQQQGVREYDFLAGVGRHKLDWGAEVKQSKRILAGLASWKNHIIISGPSWEDVAKTAVRRLVPDRLLAKRRTLANGMPRTKPLDRNQAVRNALASSYFHLRLPRLVHPFRNAYQLSISSNGAGRKISLRRRSQPVARILCYHRVNDDGDPFFPAVSTRLFEAEMRYLARHYNVVSLSELTDRLKSNVPEPVLAITLDDGYQDNFQNAFPILKRYNLPATIFLSTGPIDSRQPLWFETLAHTLKTTEYDHLDVEIDFPRRFWLRSLAERLQANDGIFELLRRLSDSERQKRLTEILTQAGISDDSSCCGRMLTWDQVRMMKRHRVDFGGHTVTHPFVSKLTGPDTIWEVSECKRRIEQELQSPVDHFAYPNGRSEDFNDTTKVALREAGYRAAVTTIWGMNDPSTDLMELRRGGPWEKNCAVFAYKLDWYDLVNG
jgi:peptidoglycan/xylan/chitin deacetylase (PgdA/CDA1 family)/CelD/BcsL family acetyltransferase involved in cellulose biosynthesis